jgi:putative colanic acid biosynthesis glycosyltransferase WcaI
VRVAVVSCVFPPEPVVSSRTSFDVAREMSARGHQVTVVAPFPSRPAGRLRKGFHRRLFTREQAAAGFSVIRCFSFLSPRSLLVSRLAENMSFGITSALALAFTPRPDVIYANTWPIFAGAMTAFVASLRRVPLVISVQDLYPESLTSQRRPLTGAIARPLLALDRWIVRRASAVVAISERFAEHYRRTRSVDPSRIHVVANWLSADGTDENAEAAQACRHRHSVPSETFLLVYAGNVGASAAVDSVIEAIGATEGVHLLIAGEGAALDQCRQLAADVAPDRIHFESPWTDTMGVLHAADVVVLPTSGQQSTTSVPSKLISYLLAARPVLAVAENNSDIAVTIHNSGSGMTVSPHNLRTLTDGIEEMIRLPDEERHRMGQAGRAWALAHATTEVCLPRLVDIIEGLGR